MEQPDTGTGSTSGTERPPNKITEGTLVPHLLFAFFSHDSERYQRITTGEDRDKAIDKLIIILNVIYSAIQNQDFNRKIRPWINEDFIKDNMDRRRKLYQYYDQIREMTIRFTPEKAAKLRNVLAAICSAARDVFLAEESQDYEYINKIRTICDIVPDKTAFRSQVTVLGQIESELKKLDSKPSGAVSFDQYYNLIIKIQRSDFFPPVQQMIGRREAAVIGRFIVYRRLFTITKLDIIYIREYLVIEKRKFGLTFRWETEGTHQEIFSVFNGVGFFTDGAFWLIGHSVDPYKRMRIMTVNIADWQRHATEPEAHRFCSGVVVSQKEEGSEKIPQSRFTLLRRQTSHDWKDEAFDSDRVRALTREELQRVLPEDRIAELDE